MKEPSQARGAAGRDPAGGAIPVALFANSRWMFPIGPGVGDKLDLFYKHSRAAYCAVLRLHTEVLMKKPIPPAQICRGQMYYAGLDPVLGSEQGGIRPVLAVYSSFLQRAYDQVLHDVCIQNLPVVFAIDRAGLVGSDGETHQGIFDLSYLSSIPNMHIMAPKNKWELSDMLKFAVEFDGPIALRYPRGEA